MTLNAHRYSTHRVCQDLFSVFKAWSMTLEIHVCVCSLLCVRMECYGFGCYLLSTGSFATYSNERHFRMGTREKQVWGCTANTCRYNVVRKVQSMQLLPAQCTLCCYFIMVNVQFFADHVIVWNTIFARSDAAATIYCTARFLRLLFKSGDYSRTFINPKRNGHA